MFSSILNVPGQNKKILFVLSAEDTLLLNSGKKERQTGVFLNEFYYAYKAIATEGYEVDFATPKGQKATIDQESLEDDYWKENPTLKQEAIDFWEKNKNFSSPITLEQAIDRSGEYIGLVIPGGQGLMVDLYHDLNIPVLLKSYSKNNSAIGLICHAPALITTIPKDENPFVGYRVNSVSPLEEFYIERFIMKGKPENRRIAGQLKKLGLFYEKGGPGKGYTGFYFDSNIIRMIAKKPPLCRYRKHSLPA
ncbi:type 1 glutamine amidotransferase domain-containing protein [Pararhodonellum marinum]|uniref:type 1 glutamine amidotransferase domain-containing protein n=1 Tax=Pararhodonellum marinum TaxID=2755358 RepID=UPI00188FBE32|nr:type 1 glutamine amidotransferase domain-containing protein [Pararhodonellum marinum]